MADLTRGKTFTTTETVTNTKLHQLVDSATIANIASADFALAATNPIHVGTTAPSDSNSKFWYDTTNNLFLVKDAGGTFQPTGRGHEYTNKSGASLDAGDLVILDTANATAVKTTTSASSVDAWGVCVNTAANDATVYVLTEGFVPALKVTGATAIGDYLYTSTTAKKADPNSSYLEGAFARSLTADSSSVEVQLLGGGAAQFVTSSNTVRYTTGSFTSDGTNNRTITTSIPVGSTLVEILVTNQNQGTYSHWHSGDSGNHLGGAGSISMNVNGTTTFSISGLDFIVGTAGVNSGAVSVGWTAKYVV